MVRKALLGGVFATMTAFAPVSAQSDTLTDALIAAYNNSHLLDQNRALVRAADEGVAQSVAALRPVLSFILGATYSQTNTPVNTDTITASAGLQARLNVYDSGSNKLAVEAAKESVLSARAGLLNIEQAVLRNAVAAYADVRSASENVALGQSNVRLITEQLRAARDRFEVGEVTRTDVSQAESSLALAQSNLVAAEGALVRARESYRAEVGRYPTALTGVPRMPTLPASLNEARAIAVRTHPAVLAAQHDVKVAELNEARARAARGPSISATASATRIDGGVNSGSVGLELSQTLYSGGALASAERQAIANRESSRAAMLRTVQQVEQNVANAWADLAVSQAQITSSDKRIRAAQLAFDGTREEARLGSRTTLDVLDAQQDLLDAQTARVTAETSLFNAHYALLQSVGLLTVEHLGLGIPTYDPAAYYNSVKSAPARSPQGAKLDRVLKGVGRN